MSDTGIRKRFTKWLKRSGRPSLNRFLARYSEVGDPVVFDPNVFPWRKIFEQNHPGIRAEAERLLEIRDALPSFHEVSPYQARISSGDSWKTVWLYGFGYSSDVVRELCPLTSQLIDQVPGLETAFFSMLAPGNHIPPHRGVFKGLINYHLGVLIPKDKSRIRMRVGSEVFSWEEGQSRIFDDTNEHEVWNDTDEERVVLMLQFRRPFRAPAAHVSELFLKILRRTPYLAVPLRNVQTWDSELRAVAESRGYLPRASDA